MRLIDITGQRFGRLTVLRRNGTATDRSPAWLCRCDCGQETVPSGRNLRSGNTQSCGCLHDEGRIAAADWYERYFDPKVLPEPNSGCWLWLGAVNADGYGEFQRDGKTRGAHVVSYEHHRGAVPAGLELDHMCRTRCCANPWHLEPVTAAVNILRGNCPPAVNARKTHCNHGHEFTQENTYTLPRENRQCRTCARARYLNWRARHSKADA